MFIYNFLFSSLSLPPSLSVSLILSFSSVYQLQIYSHRPSHVKYSSWAVVVAQLAERSLPTPEIRGLNPDISNISNVLICQLLSRKDDNKEK